MIRPVRSLVMAVLLGSCLGACGDEAASAVVDGRRYEVGAVRDISVADADLSPYATVSDSNVRSYFLDGQAYALPLRSRAWFSDGSAYCPPSGFASTAI
jgi:hypothetical protein